MIQWLKHILQWSLTFEASVYTQKFIYKITQKVYASIKPTKKKKTFYYSPQRKTF